MTNCDTEESEIKAIQEIVTKNNFIYFNFPKKIKSNPKFLYKDGSHLSEAGNKFLGEYLYKNIVENKNFNYLF